MTLPVGSLQRTNSGFPPLGRQAPFTRFPISSLAGLGKKTPHSTIGPAPSGNELNTKHQLHTRPSDMAACPRMTKTPLFTITARKPNQEARDQTQVLRGNNDKHVLMALPKKKDTLLH